MEAPAVRQSLFVSYTSHLAKCQQEMRFGPSRAAICYSFARIAICE